MQRSSQPSSLSKRKRVCPSQANNVLVTPQPDGSLRLFQPYVDEVCFEMPFATYKREHTYVSVFRNAEGEIVKYSPWKYKKIPSDIFEIKYGEYKDYRKQLQTERENQTPPASDSQAVEISKKAKTARRKGKEKIPESIQEKRTERDHFHLTTDIPNPFERFTKQEEEQNQVVPLSPPDEEVKKVRNEYKEKVAESISEIEREAEERNHFHLEIETHQKQLEETLGFHYISSPDDQVHLVTVAPVALISKETPQFGMYAREDIPKDTVLGRYLGKKFTLAEAKNLVTHYFMEVNEVIYDAKNEGNFARFPNFSRDCSNIEFIQDYDDETNETYVKIVATTNIKKGSQLLIDYGKNYKFDFEPAFLHPTDNDQNANNLLASYGEYYHEVVDFSQYDLNLQHLGIKSTDKAYVPIYMLALLNGFALSEIDPITNSHLPLLRINEEGGLIPLSEQERVTSLMVATFLGNRTITEALLTEGAEANIQQAQSGRNALHIALMNMPKINLDHEKSKTALGILMLLLKDNSLIMAIDKEKKTPIYTAIDFADPQYLLFILKNSSHSLLKLLSTPNEEELDPLLYALHYKKYIHAKLLVALIIGSHQQNEYLTMIKKLLKTSKIEFDLELPQDLAFIRTNYTGEENPRLNRFFSGRNKPRRGGKIPKNTLNDFVDELETIIAKHTLKDRKTIKQ